MSPLKLALALGMALALCTSEARAGDEASRERAERDFADGVRRFEMSDFEGARASFLRALGAVRSPAILFNLARAEEKLGDPQAAVDAYEAYLRDAGTASDLGLAASLAIAEIKERSARLRVESHPSSAVVEIDGRVQRERTPTVVLVRPGVHRVKVVGAGLDETRVVTLERPADETTLSVVRPETQKTATSAREPSEPAVTGFYGAALALIPYRFLGTPRVETATRFADENNVTLGLAVEAGLAVAKGLHVGADGFAAVGTYGHPNYVVGGGMGILYRFDVGLWIRAGATIAAVDSNKDGRVLSTDVVLGPSLDVSYELAQPRFGAWIVSAGACLLPADAIRDNDALFFPIRLGVRVR